MNTPNYNLLRYELHNVEDIFDCRLIYRSLLKKYTNERIILWTWLHYLDDVDLLNIKIGRSREYNLRFNLKLFTNERCHTYRLMEYKDSRIHIFHDV